MSSLGLEKPTASSESEDDSDYIPSAEDSDRDDASGAENDSASDDAEPAAPSAPKKRKRVKTKAGVPRKRRGGIRLDGEEEGEDAALRKDKSSVPDSAQVDETTALAVEKEKNDELWADFLRDVGPRPKKDATPAPSTAAEPEKPSSSKSGVAQDKGKVKVLQALEFAGETIVVEKEVAADSKEAKSFATLQRLQDGFTQEKLSALPEKKDKKPIGALGVLNQLTNKKQKISTLEKSKLDWERYKQERGIVQELQSHNRGKDGYLEKQAFLERADQRQFEIEKAMRAKNRSQRF